MTCCGSEFQRLGTRWVKKDILSFVLNVPAINFSQRQVVAILGLNMKRKNWSVFTTYSQHYIPQSSFSAFFFFPNALSPEITNTEGQKLVSSMTDAEQNFQLYTRQRSPGFDIMPLSLFLLLPHPPFSGDAQSISTSPDPSPIVPETPPLCSSDSRSCCSLPFHL